MHLWNANIVMGDGRSFKGQARIVSQHLLTVRGHELLAQDTSCRVCVKLPEVPGGSVLRQVDIPCSVNQAFYGGNAVHLKMKVKSLPPEGRQVFLANCLQP